MRVARRLANWMLRSGVQAYADAEPALRERAASLVIRVAAGLGAPVPRDMRADTLARVVRVFADAMAKTPYGRPLRFDSPLIISLSTSNSCPFACSNCYSSSLNVKAEARRDTAPEVYRRVAESDAPFVIVTGGEPLLSKGLQPGVETLLRAGKFVYVSTNHKVDQLLPLAVEHPDNLFFFLPVWGDPTTHDAIRGAGSFARVERNLEKLNAHGLRGKLYLVASSNDFGVFDAAETLADRHQVGSAAIVRMVGVGRVEGPRLQVTPAYRREFAGRLRRLRRRIRDVSVDVPEIPRPRRWFAERVLGVGRQTQCAAGNWLLHLDETGSGYPCFVFETNKAASTPWEGSAAAQWRQVQAGRRLTPESQPCIGE